MAKINVNNNEITVLTANEMDFISLTDMANSKETASRAAVAFATSLWLAKSGLTKLGTTILLSSIDLIAILVPSLFAQTSLLKW